MYHYLASLNLWQPQINRRGKSTKHPEETLLRRMHNAANSGNLA